MWISDMFSRLDAWTGGNGALFLAVCGGGVLLLVALTVACLCKNGGIYAGCAATVVGGIEWAIFATGTSAKTAAFFRAVAWLAVGALGLFTVAVLALLRRREHATKRLLLATKNKGELLPERDNSYVRARLHTVLRSDGAESNTRKSVPYENCGSVRLGYARRLLAGVQDAPLSSAERLETEELARLFGEYALQESWTAEQLRAVNEMFARLLKLAAKYSVEG